MRRKNLCRIQKRDISDATSNSNNIDCMLSTLSPIQYLYYVFRLNTKKIDVYIKFLKIVRKKKLTFIFFFEELFAVEKEKSQILSIDFFFEKNSLCDIHKNEQMEIFSTNKYQLDFVYFVSAYLGHCVEIFYFEYSHT
jgi:hypothetical protein